LGWREGIEENHELKVLIIKFFLPSKVEKPGAYHFVVILHIM
jgi:hypothetical protein